MRFTEEIGRQYMGQIDQALLGYASDEEVRTGAASGGAVSALLLHLLERGEIDGAVVTRVKCDDGRIDSEVVLATDRETVFSARTSKYFDVPLVRECRRLLKGFDGKVAVVALPCHAAVLRRLARRDPELASRIRYIVALFCGHSSDRYLLDKLLEKKGIDQSVAVDFAFRRGRWRGRMCGRLADGAEFSFPFFHYSYYHNLNFFCLPRCLRCHDHTGYESDFSAGDAWLRELKAEPIKHSILLSRHEGATAVLDEMAREGKLVARAIDAATVFRAQKRSLIYHYNVSARSRAARWHGVRIPDTVHTKVRWNDWLAAQLILTNYRLSRDPRTRDWVMRVPRPIIMGYFLFLKLLQNF
jgi:coenzyme F420-reducing hydrogenase beta subunit